VDHLAADRARITIVGELAIRLGNRVIEACAERHVLLMPLKGLLVLSRWPSLQGQRDLVDIDLLVRSSDFGTVSEVLGLLGFEATVPSSAGTTFASDAWPLSIDLHQDLFPHGLFRMSAEGVLSRAERDASLFARPVLRMSDEDLFAHLIGHFVKGRGTFREDTSLDDLHWLLRQGLFRPDDAGGLGAHLGALGLHRAAGYVLSHPSFADDPVAAAVLRSLRWSRLDRATVAIAQLGTRLSGETPPWWTPHLLDRSLIDGGRSLCEHVNEARLRIMSPLMQGREST
jgi:hypothetical protein